MKKVRLIEGTDKWDIYQKKRDFIANVILKSINLKTYEFNMFKIAEAQALNISVIVQTGYYIVVNYNNAENHNIDQSLLYREKRDATIDYILEDNCRYEEFVENWTLC